MSQVIRNLVRGFENNDFRVDYLENDDVIRIYQRLEKANAVATIIIIGPQEEQEPRISISLFNFCSASNVNLSLYYTINNINKQYRWFKTYIDEEHNNDIVLSADAIVDVNSPYDETFELVLRGLHLADMIYPELMKVIWR